MKVMDFFKKVFSGKQEAKKKAPVRAKKSATARKPVARKKKELDFFKFTSTDPTRLFMNGVYMEGFVNAD